MSIDPDQQITQLLRAAEHGDASAADDLLPLVYERLKALAAARLRQTPPGQTLQPTALVHEAYLKVVGSSDPGWNGRHHFFAAAARAMHNILVDKARRKATVKHGGGRRRVGVEHLSNAFDPPPDDLVALGETLAILETRRPRQHQIVMLRFFGGLTVAEAAEVVGIDERTARRDWLAARLFLLRQLEDDPEPSSGDGDGA